MKKTIKLLMCLLLIIANFSIVKAEVYETLVKEKLNNVYYVRRGNGLPYVSGPHSIYTMDGKAAYCIEPGAAINTNSYVGVYGVSNTGFNQETNRMIELIGYYGYDYPTHQTQMYRLATQALIWNAVNGQTIEYWTEHYGYGNYIDDSAERNEIMNLINTHYIKPSFDGNYYEITLGDTLELIDTNNVLSEYDIFTNDFVVVANNNNITFIPHNTGEFAVNIVKKKYDNKTTIIYSGNNTKSQLMGFFRYSDDVIASIKIKVNGGTLSLNKLDSFTKTNVPIVKSASLENAIYDLYDSDNKLIGNFSTDNNGHIFVPNLPIGDYYVVESKASYGYELDNTIHSFTITRDNPYVELNIYENIIEDRVAINKYTETNNKLKSEQEIVFEVYDSDDIKYAEIITDVNGYGETYLPFGKYRISQKNSSYGYMKANDIVVDIVDSTEPQIYNLLDKEITAKLKVNKIDLETHNKIQEKNITFKIKNLLTDEYVCMHLDYPRQENICEFKTDENGVFITPQPLAHGRYALEEKTFPLGYKNEEIAIRFNIDEDTNFKYINNQAFIEIDVYNQKETYDLTISKVGETIEGENKLLSGVEFALYAEEDISLSDDYIYFYKNDLVDKCRTNDMGICKFKSLIRGEYKLVELYTLNEYELEDVKKIDVKSNKCIQIVNYLKKGNFDFVKLDKYTNKPVENALIGIYYRDKLIYSGYTNNEGKLDINSLPLGTYELKELLAPDGYQINESIVQLEITDGNNELITLYNEKYTIDVPNTYSSLNIIIIPVSILLLIVLLVYARKIY